jgi:hypothetical protein
MQGQILQHIDISEKDCEAQSPRDKAVEICRITAHNFLILRGRRTKES